MVTAAANRGEHQGVPGPAAQGIAHPLGTPGDEDAHEADDAALGGLRGSSAAGTLKESRISVVRESIRRRRPAPAVVRQRWAVKSVRHETVLRFSETAWVLPCPPGRQCFLVCTLSLPSGSG